MSRNSSGSNNEPAVPNASNFLNNFKYEVANELGMNNYQNVDKGQLTSRENGYVGGYMVRKMIQFAEQNMPTNGGTSTTMSSNGTQQANSGLAQTMANSGASTMSTGFGQSK